MPLVVTLLLVSLAMASETKTAAASDATAFSNALNLTDPQKKLDALKAFLAQYPKSSKADRAQDSMLETLTKDFPNRSSEIRHQVHSMLKADDGEAPAFSYNAVATTLANAGVLLPFAEKLEKEAEKRLTLKWFMAWVRKMYLSAKMPPPSDADIQQGFKLSHAIFLATTGLIYYKEGRTAEAQLPLRQAYSLNPDNSVASALLGMLAARDGQTKEALSYLTRARLTGKLDQDGQAKLESLYTTVPSSASLPMDKYLDSQYAATFPLSGRVVLAELFTGSGCPPCVGSDVAMEADLERYDRDQLVMLALDVHIPRPDPLANPATMKRLAFYQGNHAPTLVVDGNMQTPGGTDRARAKSLFEKSNKLIEEAAQVAPEASIQL